MKPGLLLAALFACLPVPATAAPTEGTIMRRTTLLVHDLDASIAFYRRIGFEKWYEGADGTANGQGLPVEGVRIGDPTKFVIMKGKDPYIGMIGLLQYGPRQAPPGPPVLRRGDAILMIETTGLEAIEADLKAAGARFLKPMETSRIRSVDQEWDARFLMVFDPDGRLVEVTERLN